MSDQQYQHVKETITGRRSISGAKMNEQLIPDGTVHELLELAHWAPTHGRTEPWQFLVYTGTSLQQFGQAHADLYWQHTAEDKRMQATYEKLKNNIAKASHLVIAVMKRGGNPKIPQIEEVAAAAAAIQNILLGAQAQGIASFWSTGGMTHSQGLKDLLQLGAEDIVLGLLSLGYTDEPARAGVRNSTSAQKVKWL